MTGTHARTRARELEWTRAGRDGTPHAIDVYTNFLNGVAREPCGPTYDMMGRTCILILYHAQHTFYVNSNPDTGSPHVAYRAFFAHRSAVVRSSNYESHNTPAPTYVNVSRECL